MYDRNKPPLYQLAEISSILRSENGCAWDREQTPKSLKPYLIEEAYELYDAIENEDNEHTLEELGDLLYQIYAHAQIASEKGLYDIDDVAMGISEKLVRRHPHVFGDEQVKDSSEVLEKWEQIKKKEKSERESILDGVPNHLPALLKAYRVQEKVSRVGFDWDNPDDALLKLDEEVAEFREAVASGKREHLVDEAGDILFSMVNVLRLCGVDAEEALQGTTKKFMSRFGAMERECRRNDMDMKDMGLEELDILWEKAKSGDI